MIQVMFDCFQCCYGSSSFIFIFWQVFHITGMKVRVESWAAVFPGISQIGLYTIQRGEDEYRDRIIIENLEF